MMYVTKYPQCSQHKVAQHQSYGSEKTYNHLSLQLLACRSCANDVSPNVS